MSDVQESERVMLKKLNPSNRVLVVFYLGVVSAIITVLLIYFQALAEEDAALEADADGMRATTDAAREASAIAFSDLGAIGRRRAAATRTAAAKRVPVEVD